LLFRNYNYSVIDNNYMGDVMTLFKVTWENEYEAKDAREAAEMAQNDLREPYDWVYVVTNKTTNETEGVDLEIGVIED